MRSVCVGRQPIFDRNRRIAGWELLFRNASGVRGEISDGDQATAQTLLNAVVEIGLHKVSGGEPVYFNCTRNFLEQKSMLLPPESCVLEVLEDIPPDPPVLESLDRLRASGYRIALDDFIFEPRLVPLVERAHIIKVDVASLGLKALGGQVEELRHFPVQLLAEKIESEHELEECHRLGFSLFQGYYLRRPETLSSKSADSSRLTVLTLLGECRKPDADIDKIARMLAADPAVSFKTLQLANSALFSPRRPISSIPQAVVVVGLNALARLATLLVLAGLDDCPSSYLEVALQRGRMCELLASRTRACSDTAYLTGLLSILDAAMGAPFSELAPELPICDEIKDALLGHAGDLGALLKTVIAYESGEPGLNESGIPADCIESAFWDAARHADQTAVKLGVKQAPARQS